MLLFLLFFSYFFDIIELRNINNNTPQSQLFDSPIIQEWNEATDDWSDIGTGTLLKKLTGYSVLYDQNRQRFISGNVLTGTQSRTLDATNNGWNLVGNPYPSAIDWERITVPQEISTTFYAYDAMTENFKLYQQGGVTLNQGQQYILPAEAFFVNATGIDPTLNTDNESRIHFINSAKATKDINNLLTFRTSK